MTNKIKYFIYPIVAIFSLMVLHFYASSSVAQAAAQGSYFSSFKQAFMGGYGNTIYALLALLCSVIGIIRNVLSTSSISSLSFLAKIIGLINIPISLIAIYTNGNLAYLKLSDGGQTYTSLLGPSIFEILICFGLLVGFFLKPNRNI